MENTKNTTVEAQGANTIEQNLEYWNNEYEYFMDAMEGLKMSHAILSQMASHAKSKMQELDPNFTDQED